MKKVSILVVICLLVLCGCQEKAVEKVEDTKDNEETEHETGERMLDAWVVYWDMDSVEDELTLLNENLRTLSYFEAYFDGDHKLAVPDGFIETCKTINNTNAQTYITVVNDVVFDDGSSNLLKNTALLYDILSEEQKMRQHIEDLIGLALELSVDGIEIDYENIREDMELWGIFETFCAELSSRMQEEGLSLRILLEPSAPYETLKLPKEAEYVIMCYNLHSGAGNEGPKADEAFLKELVKKAENLEGNLVFALATGGFDWFKGDVESLKELDAVKLAEKQGAEVSRDQNSQALTFTYKENGTKHTVWYADGSTMASWIAWVKEAGDYDIAIWRLNGNEESSIVKWTNETIDR
jgi:Predicted glycosyl hydrolase